MQSAETDVENITQTKRKKKKREYSDVPSLRHCKWNKPLSVTSTIVLMISRKIWPGETGVGFSETQDIEATKYMWLTQISLSKQLEELEYGCAGGPGIVQCNPDYLLILALCFVLLR